MGWHDDKERKKDTEHRRAVKEDRLATRKGIARRIYESGGTFDEMARQSGASHDTVKRWAKEDGWKRDADT